MSGLKIVIDARKATKMSEIRRYLSGMLPAMLPKLAEDETLHVLLSGEAPTDWLPSHPRLVPHVIAAPYPSLSNHWQTFMEIRRIRPHITHGFDVFLPLTIPGRLVITVTDMIPIAIPRYCSFGQRLLWRYRSFRAFMTARRLICSRSEQAATIKKRFNRAIGNRTRLVQVGVGGEFSPQSEERQQRIRDKYQLPDRYMLYVGTAEPRRNLATLIGAFSKLGPNVNTSLVVLGADAGHNPYRREAEKLEQRVVWLSEAAPEDLPAIYSAASVLLHPSLAEGFCFPVIEAMACGTPVLCSAIPALREVVGNAGKLLHPTSESEWCTTIQNSVTAIDFHDTYRMLGLQRAPSFSWDAAAAEILHIYRSLYPKRVSRG